VSCSDTVRTRSEAAIDGGTVTVTTQTQRTHRQDTFTEYSSFLPQGRSQEQWRTEGALGG